MEDIYSATAPTDPLGLVFELEDQQRAQYSRIVARWPNVTDDEYLQIIWSIWLNDWFDQDALCHMKYEEFLRTRYWRVISQAAKKAHPYCQDCCEYLQQLHVHHLTYERRGQEWLHPEDLIVLCHSCHRARHGR